MSRYNDILLQSIVLLISLGLIMVYSASINPFHGNTSGISTLINQFKWLLLGSFGLFVTTSSDAKNPISSCCIKMTAPPTSRITPVNIKIMILGIKVS